MPGPTIATPKKVLSAIHNIPKKMKSGHLFEQRRASGKENIPPGENTENRFMPQYSPDILVTSPSSQLVDRQKWLPKDGNIIIKVAVPATDDLWKFKVPEDIELDAFLARVQAKVGFSVVFRAKAGKMRERHIATDRAFKTWIAGRVSPETGKNTPLVAHLQL
ncbi:predicted protein [Postia placenta Mad-698-R]|uniref:Uncharacterized protein n=1 Tax=Rhodonia placenta TaxID=104341 RepID=A0A8H7P1E2_9APHY|nr:predicted protein [Postia placenta Mad-698-R]KAF9812812.1 hypothetical protein IEO21_05959 [Postia placenta]